MKMSTVSQLMTQFQYQSLDVTYLSLIIYTAVSRGTTCRMFISSCMDGLNVVFAAIKCL